MRIWHIDDGGLKEGAPAANAKSSARIEVLAADDASLGSVGHDAQEVLRQLPHAAIPFMEHLPSGAVGVIAAPSEDPHAAPRERMGFLLECDRIRFIGAPDACCRALTALEHDRAPIQSAAGALCALMRYTVREHPAALSKVRSDLEELEERLLEGYGRVDRRRMMADIHRMLGLDTLYQGMSDIAGELSEIGEGLVLDGDRLRFRALGRQLDRLAARLESLQDYSLQLNSLYQEGIDIRQNTVMQWLTVVTTIFMPMTFITGWYGMNFPNMVLPHADWGYPLVVAVCIIIAVLEILYFQRRGWLHFGGRARKRRSREHYGKRA